MLCKAVGNTGEGKVVLVRVGFVVRTITKKCPDWLASGKGEFGNRKIAFRVASRLLRGVSQGKTYERDEMWCDVSTLCLPFTTYCYIQLLRPLVLVLYGP